jgi:hypothetical protein
MHAHTPQARSAAELKALHGRVAALSAARRAPGTAACLAAWRALLQRRERRQRLLGAVAHRRQARVLAAWHAAAVRHTAQMQWLARQAERLGGRRAKRTVLVEWAAAAREQQQQDAKAVAEAEEEASQAERIGPDERAPEPRLTDAVGSAVQQKADGNPQTALSAACSCAALAAWRSAATRASGARAAAAAAMSRAHARVLLHWGVDVLRSEAFAAAAAAALARGIARRLTRAWAVTTNRLARGRRVTAACTAARAGRLAAACLAAWRLGVARRQLQRTGSSLLQLQVSRAVAQSSCTLVNVRFMCCVWQCSCLYKNWEKGTS